MTWEELRQIAKDHATPGDVEIVKFGRKEIAQAVAALSNQDEAFALVIRQDALIESSLLICILPQKQRKSNKEDVGNVSKLALGMNLVNRAKVTFTEEPTE